MRPLKAIPQKEYTSYGFTSLETPLKTELLLVVDLSFYSLEFCKPNCIGNLKLPMKVRLSNAKKCLNCMLRHGHVMFHMLAYESVTKLNVHPVFS